MFGTYWYRVFIAAKSILQKLRLILTGCGKVTVLFILLASPGPMRADNVNGIGLRQFEFTSEFYMPMGRGRFDGLMACDGSQYRIAIYWIEPAVYHDNTFFLGDRTHRVSFGRPVGDTALPLGWAIHCYAGAKSIKTAGQNCERRWRL